MVLRLVLRLALVLALVWAAVAPLIRALAPGGPALVYLQKPSRVASSELAAHDLRLNLVQPLTTDANVLSYALEPGGRRLIYITQIAGAHAFYTLDLHTRRAHFLMSDPTQAITPTWAPNGDRLAYDNYDARAIFVTNMRTLRTRRLFAYDGVTLAFPDWSPDGTSLVMTAPHPETNRPDLMRYSFADAGVEWLTNTPEAESHPRFSPDGTHIVYRMVRGARHYLVARNLSTGTAITLFTTDDELWGPDWSPDGARVAFQVIEGTRSNIYLIDTDTREVFPLTDADGWVSNPVWLASLR